MFIRMPNEGRNQPFKQITGMFIPNHMLHDKVNATLPQPHFHALGTAAQSKLEDTRFLFKKLLKASQSQIAFLRDAFRHLLPFNYTWQ